MQKKTENPHRYDDIIDLPRHVSTSHQHMAVSDRAAQFSPFAALTGYESAVQETARLTNQKVELDENSKEALNKKFMLVQEKRKEHPAVTVTYFVPDDRKDGGSYENAEGRVKKIQDFEGVLIFMDGTRIPLEDIVEIDSEIFSLMEP